MKASRLERTLTLPLMGLLTMPIALPLEKRRFEQAQMRAAGELLRVADETRRAYFGAVAAQQSAAYMEQVKDSGRRQRRTGAPHGRGRQLEQAAAGARAGVLRRRRGAAGARAPGQRGRARTPDPPDGPVGRRTPRSSCPTRLPDLPAAPREVSDAEAQAMTNRLDMLMAQKELAGLAVVAGPDARHPLRQPARPVLPAQHDAGRRARERLRDRVPDPAVRLGQRARGQGRSAVHAGGAPRRRRRHRRALARCASPTSPTAPPTTWRATTATKSCRCKKRISDEQLLRYNGMLIGVFELLADAREQVDERQRRDRSAARLLDGRFGTARGNDRRRRRRAGSAHARRACGRRCAATLIAGKVITWFHAEISSAAPAQPPSPPPWSAGSARHRCPKRVIMDNADTQRAAGAAERPPLQPGRHAERLDAALAHEGRRQGIPPGGRTGGARDRARHEGQPVGLQRPVAGADHRGGRGRPRAHFRHQQAARTHQHPLARPAPAERHGRRDRPDPARPSRSARPSSTNSSRAGPAPSCTTRTPTK